MPTAPIGAAGWERAREMREFSGGRLVREFVKRSSARPVAVGAVRRLVT